ncbi:hypothetical protein A0H76_1751 [Hepatospora eriocheir]|uniref:Uncharacterized protein n=1 Tax=Hepatospora eriocheir TaxID=1081669 RepID=A0A1X0Q5M2_9MICR|nr:hypothetical protein A0H76_1751 [Hepatospora eriocheir]
MSKIDLAFLLPTPNVSVNSVSLEFIRLIKLVYLLLILFTSDCVTFGMSNRNLSIELSLFLNISDDPSLDFSKLFIYSAHSS